MEWINAFLYIALFIVLYRFNRNRFSIFISAIWGFSAFLGLFYVHSEVYREGVYKTSLIPFLYLFLMFLISIFPFIKEKDSIKNISFRSPKIIKIFCFFVALISVFPFSEAIFRFAQSIADGTILLIGANYDDYVAGREDAIIQFSRWGNRGITILQWLKVVTPILFIYYIQQNKYNKFVAIGLFMGASVPSLVNIAIGSKTELFFFILYFISLYFYLKDTFDEKTSRVFKKLIKIMCCVTVAFVFVLSIGRYVIGNYYGSSNSTPYSFLFQYSSESMFNFNENAFHEKKHFGGTYTFFSACKDLGLTNIDYQDRRSYFSAKMKGSPSLFYTYIGELVLDYGLIGATFVASIISILFSYIKRTKTITFDRLLLIGLYIYIIANSIFYFCFKLGFYPIYTTIICSIIFRVINVKKIKT